MLSHLAENKYIMKRRIYTGLYALAVLLQIILFGDGVTSHSADCIRPLVNIALATWALCFLLRHEAGNPIRNKGGIGLFGAAFILQLIWIRHDPGLPFWAETAVAAIALGTTLWGIWTLLRPSRKD